MQGKMCSCVVLDSVAVFRKHIPLRAKVDKLNYCEQECQIREVICMFPALTRPCACALYTSAFTQKYFLFKLSKHENLPSDH